MPSDPIYLDFHATTPVLPEVFEAMRPYFTTHFGNAASRSHAFGWRAAEAVDLSRHQVADLLGVPSGDILFTSGATEGINFLVKSLGRALAYKGRHIVSVQTEHPAVLDSLAALTREGFQVTLLGVDAGGRLDLKAFAAALRQDTIMAVIMWANNETGVIHPMDDLGAFCRDAGVLLISDATQAVGKIPVQPISCGVQALAFSAHKIYGPKGVGAVYLHPTIRRYKPEPLLHGGGHEGHLRSGTLNVPGIVGLGATAAHCRANMLAEGPRLASLRDQLEASLLQGCPEARINGDLFDRLPTVTNILLRFTESQAVMSKFRSRLAISSGSACSSADPSPSHVLLAMGLSQAEARASFRFSLGVPTSEAEVDAAAAMFIEAVAAYRADSPVWQMHLQGLEIREW